MTSTEVTDISQKLDKLITLFTPQQNIFFDLAFWNALILAVTLGVLIWYTIETHKIAIQTKESNLRPVVLRRGFIKNWDEIKYEVVDGITQGKPLEFMILKNIATSISGYLIINNFKFKLLFCHDISKVDENKFITSENWGWIEAGSTLYAVFDESKKTEVKNSNQIVINYKDIEGNAFFTIEDVNFTQKSLRGTK